MQISIHTSAREVTKWWRGFHYGTGISIHTSAREVTRVLLIAPCKKGNFNPHFRKGSDRRFVCMQHRIGTYFNPHFRKGSDQLRIKYRLKLREFQSTLPQGKWRLSSIWLPGIGWFQSTLPQGKWLQYFTKTSVYFYEISINIFEFTFVYYWNTLSIQKAHSNLFIFTGASLPVILCMLDTRTCKL